MSWLAGYCCFSENRPVPIQQDNDCPLKRGHPFSKNRQKTLNSRHDFFITGVTLQVLFCLLTTVNRTLFISALLLFAILGTFYLWKINQVTPIHPWDLVPEDALAVYEQNNDSKEGARWLLKPYVPDSVVMKLLDSKDLLISLHVLGKQELGTVAYTTGSLSIQQLIGILKSSQSFKERVFEGYKIMEVSGMNKHLVSAVAIDQVLVVSSTSFLVEDVVRIAKSKGKDNFSARNAALFQFAKVESDGGKLYVNLSQLPALTGLVTGSPPPTQSRLANAAVADIRKEQGLLLFNGFAVDTFRTGGSLLSIFNSQRPVPITLQKVISNRTGLLLHSGISDFVALNHDRMEFCKVNRMPAGDSIDLLNLRYGFDASHFYQQLGDEIGVCRGGIFSGEVVVVKLKSPSGALSDLRKLRPKIKIDSMIREHYSQLDIFPLVVSSLPMTLFWPLCTTKMNYYAVAEGYLILGSEVDDLKAFIDDIDEENVWSKSPEWNKFLSNSQETNLGLIINGSAGWPYIRNGLSPRWQAVGDSLRFLNINKASFQLSRLEKNYYVSGIFQFSPKSTSDQVKEKITEVVLTRPLARPLSVVKNHNGGSNELLTQDDANHLLLLSAKLKQLFSASLPERITSDISQIDFYKNRKLQYLFAAGKSLWLVDRLGRTVNGFPKATVGKAPIQYLTAVDYDNSRNYRFLISDTQGRISMLDADGTPLTAWKEIQTGHYLVVAPRAERSNGKDYVIALADDGWVFAFNKNGKAADGFPVDLKIRPSGNWFVDKSHGVDLITLVSEDGVMVQLSFSGKVINKNNLVKSSPDSRFSLSMSNGRGVISRVDKDRIAILQVSGEVLFERQNPGSGEAYVTYSEAEHGYRIFAFTDPLQEFTYFFNATGEPMMASPLENQGSPAILTDKGNVYFYGANKNRIRSFRRSINPL